MERKNMYDVASENILVMVDVKGNSYPEYRPALIGMEDYEEAERLAKENYYTIVELHKRDWESSWNRGPEADGLLEVRAEDYGDRATIYTQSDAGAYLNEFLKPYTDDSCYILDWCILDRRLNVFSKILQLPTTIIAVVGDNGLLVDILERDVMQFRTGNLQRIIALMDDHNESETK